MFFQNIHRTLIIPINKRSNLRVNRSRAVSVLHTASQCWHEPEAPSPAEMAGGPTRMPRPGPVLRGGGLGLGEDSRASARKLMPPCQPPAAQPGRPLRACRLCWATAPPVSGTRPWVPVHGGRQGSAIQGMSSRMSSHTGGAAAGPAAASCSSAASEEWLAARSACEDLSESASSTALRCVSNSTCHRE